MKKKKVERERERERERDYLLCVRRLCIRISDT